MPDDMEQLKAVIAGQAIAIAERDDAIAEREASLAERESVPAAERTHRSESVTLFTAAELESLVAELQQGVTDSVSTDDGSDEDVGMDEPDDGDEASDRKKKRKSHGRRPLPDHLSREEFIHELTDEGHTCPCCGKLRKEIGNEVSDRQWRVDGAAAPKSEPSGSWNKPASPAGRMPVTKAIRTRSMNSA